MGFGDKIKATKALIENAAMISKIPQLVEDAINNLKSDITHLVKHAMKLNTELPDLIAKGKACRAAHLSRPETCYEKVFGPIKYSAKARKQWEKYMHKKAKKGEFPFDFNPNEYPKTQQK